MTTTLAMKTLSLILAAIVLGAFVALSMTDRVSAQTRGLSERVSVNEVHVDQLKDQVTDLRAITKANAEKIVGLESRISTIQGVGIGLSSLVMVLQLLQMTTGRRISKEGDG